MSVRNKVFYKTIKCIVFLLIISPLISAEISIKTVVGNINAASYFTDTDTSPLPKWNDNKIYGSKNMVVRSDDGSIIFIDSQQSGDAVMQALVDGHVKCLIKGFSKNALQLISINLNNDDIFVSDGICLFNLIKANNYSTINILLGVTGSHLLNYTLHNGLGTVIPITISAHYVNLHSTYNTFTTITSFVTTPSGYVYCAQDGIGIVQINMNVTPFSTCIISASNSTKLLMALNKTFSHLYFSSIDYTGTSAINYMGVPSSDGSMPTVQSITGQSTSGWSPTNTTPFAASTLPLLDITHMMIDYEDKIYFHNNGYIGCIYYDSTAGFQAKMIAGNGASTTDGLLSQAKLTQVSGFFVEWDGSIFISDNNCLIRRIANAPVRLSLPHPVRMGQISMSYYITAILESGTLILQADSGATGYGTLRVQGNATTLAMASSNALGSGSTTDNAIYLQDGTILKADDVVVTSVTVPQNVHFSGDTTLDTNAKTVTLTGSLISEAIPDGYLQNTMTLSGGGAVEMSGSSTPSTNPVYVKINNGRLLLAQSGVANLNIAVGATSTLEVHENTNLDALRFF